MKKVILPLIFILFLSSCSIDWNDEKEKKIIELENKIIKETEMKEASLKFDNLVHSKILTNAHLLKCEGKYNSSMVTSESGGLNEGVISKNSENFELTILGEKLTMFGAEFLILQNSDDYLIAMRKYDDSGLTELVHLNKANGILYDSKTYTKYIGNAPAGYDTIFNCKSQ